MPANWLVPSRFHGMDKNKIAANVPAQFSVLVCGLDLSKTDGPPLTWGVGPVPDPRVTSAVIDLPRFAVPFCRYIHQHNEIPSPPIPRHLHEPLNLSVGKSGYLFVHDASNPNVQGSIDCMHSYVALLSRYGGRGFWVIIDSPYQAELSELEARFKSELDKWPDDFERRVLAMPVVDSYRVVGETLLSFPLYIPLVLEEDPSPKPYFDCDFWIAFIQGSISPWGHKDYLRAAYLTLLQPENRHLGLLEIATKFSNSLHSFKQRNPASQLQRKSRTLTVFWLYHVKLAMTAIQVYNSRPPHLDESGLIFYYVSELANEQLPDMYYSASMLQSNCAANFWMLPDLRPLVEPLQHPDPGFRKKFTQPLHDDPERLLRFVFGVAQCYMRQNEKRRRSWFIDLAFASLEQHTIRLRSTHPQVTAYSVTKTYFYLQLVHASLSPLAEAGRFDLIAEMTYPLFRQNHRISPSDWTAHYTPKLWNSLPARAAFVPPDLKPLPTTIQTYPPYSAIVKNPPGSDPLADLNVPLERQGLIPELPPLEVLNFHRAVLLETVKSIPPSIAPSEVTSHAHLLVYTRANIVPRYRPSAVDGTGTGDFNLLNTTDYYYCDLALRHTNLLARDSVLPGEHKAFYIQFAIALALRVVDGGVVGIPGSTEGIKTGNVLPAGDMGAVGKVESEEWEALVKGDWGLMLCWDRAWKSDTARELCDGWFAAVEQRWVGGGDVRSDDEDGNEGVVEVAACGAGRSEGTSKGGVDGEVQVDEGDDDIASDDGEETLGGEGNGEDDEWEVVSQDTLC